jgi:hypothetical protein
MTTPNDSAELAQEADAEIKALFDILTRSDGALTVIGGLMARALVDKVYTGTAHDVAKRVYGLRGVSGQSAGSQIGKLANFNIVAVAWKYRGIDLVEALVQQTEGDGRRRYRIVQSVLVLLKKIAKAKAKKPSTTELGEMLTVARTGSTPDNTPDGKLARKLAKITKTLAIIKDHPNCPPSVEDACRTLESFVQQSTPRSEEP